MKSFGSPPGTVLFGLFLLAFLLPGMPVALDAADPEFKTRSLDPFDYTQTLRTTGKLRPRRNLVIKSKISENVVSLPVKEGETVPGNQRLLQFDTSLKKVSLERARHRRDRARHQFEIARKDYRRKKSLLEKDLISESEYDQSQLEYNRAKEEYEIAKSDVREAEIRYSHTSIESPFPGLLEEKRVERGERVNRGQALLHFLQINPVEVHFEVTAEERRFLSSGDSVTIRLDFSPDADPETSQHHRGTISTINQDANPNGLYTVKASIPNSQYELTPGRTVRVEVPLRRYDQLVEIPLTYVDRTSDQPRAVLYNPDDNKLRRRSLSVVDYREDSLLVRLQWPAFWKLAPGGIYTDPPGSMK